ncbi:DDB1- and CUL4-associated factor 5 [Bombus vosnesenskii]|uniref:DDB1- and CUL4-associated factor 5 n=1 Tax=Bombus vosnesenskii TaxID=207650 RepID=A0A6J3L538_9HYME|nr:DDB1- and CUL4-associated factor 5 [Bombus vosnesenskii]XP_033360393.1 DDB1- and CUL4-associated factor 5 [Bombus vosnesenskii]XP_033360394.1 DDB1- and CUL4-associated factor 5 [Bombus vosnesenskii]XP_033360395.1 DDB1- and CUL4-associated factor 5 [Bombus vosnesenskii]XP_050494021.1 DDB1- and CUL4-associated factor 5 [Bombus huntii]XP_050494022.1 DDB1- and CUL4-associated factor 5 [Bombus huntii]XP_050494023.1 DDB1- and CUL4-associated factor 5 [Bombus huntii]
MARPSNYNPLSYFVARQIDDKVDYCKRLVNARFESSENLFRKDLLSHYGCVNAIEFSNQGDLLVSGGDDRRVLLWKVEQAIQDVGKPTVMKVQHISNIFCLGYDNSKTKIFSAGNDDQVIVHDLRTGDVVNLFVHEKPVYGLSVHPHNDNVFASACDDGRVLIYDIRGSNAMETFCLARYKTAFHSVMFNPVEPRMLATANAKEGVSMWDVRKPLKPILRYGNESSAQSCMNVRFNAAGNRLLALRRRLPPVLYDVDSSTHLCQFDHPGYYNSCTMKSCCFAGDNDEYVLSGSDDFNLYMWKIPSEDVKWVNFAHMVLRGHRSIVNQVRYNQASCIFASSGVEKLIKIWSPFPLGSNCLGGLKRDDGRQERQRRVFTHDEYIGLVLRSGQFMTHDYSHQSTREDPRMMAFFDSLVQREVEGWTSEDMSTAPQTPSDSESNLITGRVYSATDSDDSTAFDRQLMSSILGPAITLASRGSCGGGVAPERPLESPNRITQLIAYRREKLMKLAAVDCDAPANNASAAASEPSASGSASDGDNAQVKCKSKSKVKFLKRKHSKITEIRRAGIKCAVLQINSDSDSDEQPVDTTQPSTSSGVVSRRSRYVVHIEREAKHSNYSSSSSEDNDISGKRKHSKTDSDTSTKVHRRKHKKCKSNSKNDSTKNKSKRQKIDYDTKKKKSGRDWKLYLNDVSNAIKIQKDGPSVPVNKSSKVPSTPDSGITSGVSTSEKNGEQAQKDQNDAESSDHEQKLKNLEYFRKKVNVVRRSYRIRSKPLSQTISTTTDSSD